jgi:hypothetical protein
MELAAFGIDTIRFAFSLSQPLPVFDSEYLVVLAKSKWCSSTKSVLLDSVDGDYESSDVKYVTTASFQCPLRPTFRSGIQNAGRSVWVECSIPAWFNGGKFNTALAHPSSVQDFILEAENYLRGVLPSYVGHESIRVRRLDPAADIFAGAARAGVIAAGSRFTPPRVRKISRGVFPGESAFISTPELGFKCYDKYLELHSKLPLAERTKQENVKLDEWASRGMVRMELTRKPRAGLNDIQIGSAANHYVQTIREGLRCDNNLGVIYIGGLASVHQQILNLDVSRNKKSMLFAFAYEIATYGDDYVRSLYSRSVFYSRRAELIDNGIMLDNLFNYDGYVDFNPVLNQIAEDYGVSCETYIPPISNKTPDYLETARVIKSSLIDEIESRWSPQSLERESNRAKKFFDPLSITDMDI